MPHPFQRIAVYCGASSHVPQSLLTQAFAVGQALARAKIGIVYGGGRLGMMGAVADGALSEGGEVIGVITDKLMDLEVGHPEISRLETRPTMHERKMRMAELADAFIALPGGIGTLEELFEAATLSQLNDHLKPCGFLNLDGYYDALQQFITHAQDLHFIRPEHRQLISWHHNLDALLEAMTQARIPKLGDWRA